MLTKPRALHFIADVRAHGAPLHLSHSKTPPDLRMLHSHPSPQPLGLGYWLLPHTPVPLCSLLAARGNPTPRENISSGQKWLIPGAPAFPPVPPRHIPGAHPWSHISPLEPQSRGDPKGQHSSGPPPPSPMSLTGSAPSRHRQKNHH